MLDVRGWAEDNLPNDDEVPLTEQERKDAKRLLRSLQVLDEEPTRVVRLNDTSIEVLQHGLMLVRSVLDHRLRYCENPHSNVANYIYPEDIQGREDSLRNVRQLYAWLENAKGQEPI